MTDETTWTTGAGEGTRDEAPVTVVLDDGREIEAPAWFLGVGS